MTALLAALPLIAAVPLRNDHAPRVPAIEPDDQRPYHHSAACLIPGPPPDYYRIDLVPTRRIPAAANATGYADVVFDESPFGVAVSASGYYRYDVEIRTEGLPAIDDHEYVVWITPPTLVDIRRIGPLVNGRRETTVVENKYLVVVTLEPAGTSGDAWTGPIVMRGISRSGLMHTMAGHGPFEGEPCAQFGY